MFLKEVLFRNVIPISLFLPIFTIYTVSKFNLCEILFILKHITWAQCIWNNLTWSKIYKIKKAKKRTPANYVTKLMRLFLTGFRVQPLYWRTNSRHCFAIFERRCWEVWEGFHGNSYSSLCVKISFFKDLTIGYLCRHLLAVVPTELCVYSWNVFRDDYNLTTVSGVIF